MGVHIVGVNCVIHYGAPKSLDDYFQESGRGGRDGGQATSTIYWSPADAPRYKEVKNEQMNETLKVRTYLENREECRRVQLLRYFDEDKAHVLPFNPNCCDVCIEK